MEKRISFSWLDGVVLLLLLFLIASVAIAYKWKVVVGSNEYGSFIKRFGKTYRVMLEFPAVIPEVVELLEKGQNFFESNGLVVGKLIDFERNPSSEEALNGFLRVRVIADLFFAKVGGGEVFWQGRQLLVAKGKKLDLFTSCCILHEGLIKEVTPLKGENHLVRYIIYYKVKPSISRIFWKHPSMGPISKDATLTFYNVTQEKLEALRPGAALMRPAKDRPSPHVVGLVRRVLQVQRTGVGWGSACEKEEFEEQECDLYKVRIEARIDGHDENKMFLSWDGVIAMVGRWVSLGVGPHLFNRAVITELSYP